MRGGKNMNLQRLKQKAIERFESLFLARMPVQVEMDVESFFLSKLDELEKAAREEIINEIMKICESIKKEPQQILGEMVETELSDRGIGYNKALADLIQELKSLR